MKRKYREVGEMVVYMHRAVIDTESELPQRFERKFYLPPNKISLAQGLLQHICRPDEEFPSERINSLYFDTAGLDQHERSSSGDFRKDKVRIRWYGEESHLHGMQTIFIELKSKEAFASTKQRRKLQVPAENLMLENLGRGIIPGSVLMDTLTGFGYFPLERLQPVIKISYWRYRYCDILSGQRVSLDCHIRSAMVMPGFGDGEKDLELEGGVIEIKGRTLDLPVTLIQLRMLEIDWSRFSKYSACIELHTEEPGVLGRLSPSGRNIGL
jgi:hypothetical protein